MPEEETKYTEYDFEGIETVEEYFDRFWNNREALEHLVNLFHVLIFSSNYTLKLFNTFFQTYKY